MPENNLGAKLVAVTMCPKCGSEVKLEGYINYAVSHEPDFPPVWRCPNCLAYSQGATCPRCGFQK